MLLACDIGNTNIKTGIFESGSLKEFKIFSSYRQFIEYSETITLPKIAISSVVPQITDKLIEHLSKLPAAEYFVIDKSVKFNLKIKYNSIETLGIDRICAAEGAFYLFRNSAEFDGYNSETLLICADLGTATTINFVQFPGEFTGGLIAPGVGIMFSSLNKNTAQLPETDESYYKNFIGHDTKSSIASGVINSTAGLIEKSINYLRTNSQVKKVKLYITGGNAEKVIPYINFNYEFVKGLVLTGIKSIHDANSSPFRKI